MMRLLIWTGLAAVAGIVLFQIKYEVQALEDHLRDTRRKIAVDREAIHILHAEWSYLNDPQRLSDLARRHLELAPMSPTQIGNLESLPMAEPQSPLVADKPTAETTPDIVRASTDTEDPIKALLTGLENEQ